MTCACSVIATADGADLILPNGDLLNSHVVNSTLGGFRKRLHIRLDVQYNTDLEQTIAAALRYRRTGVKQSANRKSMLPKNHRFRKMQIGKAKRNTVLLLFTNHSYFATYPEFLLLNYSNNGLIVPEHHAPRSVPYCRK
jgi:hypothetical protein